MTGEMTMLSKMNHSIKDLTVPVTPLTNAELEKVTGGVMMDENGRSCTERHLPISKLLHPTPTVLQF
jgi:hypothetical protein